MPSLSSASPRQWAAMYASTRIGSYEVLNDLYDGKEIDEIKYAYALPDMFIANWIIREGDHIVMTHEGNQARMGK